MIELPADIEQALRDLPDNEWGALQARLRPPDTSEQLRAAVAQHVPQDRLDAVMSFVDASKFIGENGQVDEQKVQQHMGAFFGANEPPSPRNWGQASYPGGPPSEPGQTAREALKRRHNVGSNANEPSAGGQIARGASAKAELQKRYPPKGRR
jgi:hypothetical protein